MKTVIAGGEFKNASSEDVGKIFTEIIETMEQDLQVFGISATMYIEMAKNHTAYRVQIEKIDTSVSPIYV